MPSTPHSSHLSSERIGSGVHHCPGAGSAIPDHSPLLRARPIPSWPGRSVWPSKRWGSGGPGSSNAASTACLTSRGPAAHAPSRTRCGAGRDPHPGDDAGGCNPLEQRSMAARTGLSQSAISRIWRAFALQPHQDRDVIKLSSDPLFIEKVRDIVGLYLNPPQRALVLCVDEKSQIQALDRTAPLLPMRPGQIGAGPMTTVVHGTTSLFAALDVKTGEVIGACHRRHGGPRSSGASNRPGRCDRTPGPRLHLILDNSPPTRPPPSSAGWPGGRAITCTSPPPAGS